MTVVKGSQSVFLPAPEGSFQAVCVDEILMQDQQTQWGPKDKLRVVWQIEATATEDEFFEHFGRQPTNEEADRIVGKRYLVSQFFTASLGTASKPSNLRKLLQSWRGSKITPQEDSDGFDFERMIGANCMLQIIRSDPVGDKVYANISSIMPIHKSATKIAPENYERHRDREKKSKPSDQSKFPGDEPTNDDDIPF